MAEEYTLDHAKAFTVDGLIAALEQLRLQGKGQHALCMVDGLVVRSIITDDEGERVFISDALNENNPAAIQPNVTDADWWKNGPQED